MPKVRKAWGKIAASGLLVMSVGVLAMSVAACFGMESHKLELLSNLRVPLLIASVCLAVAALAVPSPWLKLLPLAALVLNGVAVAPLYFAESKTTGGAKLTIATINIFGSRNKHYERVIEYVHTKHPDVLCLNEITHDWMRHMIAALPDYPFRFDEGIAGGAAIFSRVPLEKIPPADIQHARRYGVRGQLSFAGEPVLIVAEHPPDPLHRQRADARNAEFQRLASDVHSAHEPVIVIGDMNATAWSPYFERLLKVSGLQDSEYGFGVQPTWNQYLPLPLIPIDHCLTSKELAVTRREVGPDIGSDHLPVCVDVRMVVR
jgi:endonuclease/exonuclease/phosphatase (EEP) superfamily protein YafD